MLSTNAIFGAFALVEQLDAANTVLVPVAGTPLFHMVAASNVTSSMAQKLENGEVSFDTYGIELAANNISTFADEAERRAAVPSRHDAVTVEFTKIGGRGVQNALTIARTGAAPRITELMDLVSMRLKSATPSDLTRVEIATDEECAALYNPAFQKLVSKYENAPNVSVAMNINAPNYSTEEVLALLETGIDSLDAEIIPWAADQSDLSFVWQGFFTISEQFSGNMSFLDRMRISPKFPLLVFLLAKHLLESDEIPDGMNISLKEYKATLLNYVEQAGKLLCMNLNMAEISVKNGVLVKAISGTSIQVNVPVYNTWLENGGDNDILFGMAISQKRAFTLDAITANADEYRAGWAKYVALVTSADSSRRFTFLLDQLFISYESILGKPDAEGAVKSAQDIASEMQVFRAELRQLNASDVEDLHRVCQRLVCRTSFSDTPAELILSKMDEVARQSPTLTPREAAALATLWYISAWVSEQMTTINA